MKNGHHVAHFLGQELYEAAHIVLPTVATQARKDYTDGRRRLRGRWVSEV